MQLLPEVLQTSLETWKTGFSLERTRFKSLMHMNEVIMHTKSYDQHHGKYCALEELLRDKK